MVPIIYGHQILHQIRETTPGMKGDVKLLREKGDSREWRGRKREGGESKEGCSQHKICTCSRCSASMNKINKMYLK